VQGKNKDVLSPPSETEEPPPMEPPEEETPDNGGDTTVKGIPATEKQIKTIQNAIKYKKLGYEKEAWVKLHVLDAYNVLGVDGLNKTQASALIKKLMEKKAK